MLRKALGLVLAEEALEQAQVPLMSTLAAILLTCFLLGSTESPAPPLPAGT